METIGARSAAVLVTSTRSAPIGARTDTWATGGARRNPRAMATAAATRGGMDVGPAIPIPPDDPGQAVAGQSADHGRVDQHRGGRASPDRPTRADRRAR